MYVTGSDLRILKESLRRIQLKSDLMAATFYENLLCDAAEAVKFFSENIAKHPEKALHSLYAVVTLLEDSQVSQLMILRLRERQTAIGLEPVVYNQIAPTLERSLRQVFGCNFPNEYYRAWNVALAEVGRIIYDNN